LLGLNGEEAEALGLLLACPHPALNQMQVASAINAARDKLIESLPELVRNRIQLAQRRFKLSGGVPAAIDPRVPALAQAIRDGAVVRIKAKSRAPRTVHPVALQLAPDGWSLIDARDSQRPIRDVEVGDINISARRFAAGPSAGG
jgi:predicted DNA-binding transcriptional regulator YafY